jgi:hypothetical protein
MVLSKRERYIAFATAAVVGILALDRFMVTPLMAQREELDKQIAEQHDKLYTDQKLFKKSREMTRDWAKISSGALKQNSNEAESQALNSLQNWAQDSGIAQWSVRAEGAVKEKDFNKNTYRATGTGGMSQIARFLWRIQTAPIPVRINDLSLTARKDGTDDLSLQVGFSTIYVMPDPNRPAGNPQAAANSVPTGATRPAANAGERRGQ